MSLFRYHGPLNPTSPMFQGRQQELNQLLRHCQGEVEAYVILYGGRQTGKTSLLLRFIHQLPQTIQACRVDFQRSPSANKERVYTYLGQQIARSLNQPADITPIMDEPDLTEFLNQQLQSAKAGRFVLILEELGALPPALRQDLANVLRAIFNSRYDPFYEAFGKMLVILAGSIEMYDLAATEVSPLQNICDPLYLTDLSSTDITHLMNVGLHETGFVDGMMAETMSRAVYAQTHGHPYFSQRLGKLLEQYLQTDSWVQPPQAVLHAVKDILTDDPLLKHLHKTLHEHHLWDSCHELLTEQIPFNRFDEAMARLELTGMAGQQGGQWYIRNRLLGQALQQWFITPAKITDLLTQLTEDDLSILCYDWALLQPVYQQFKPKMSIEHRIQTIVSYCQQQSLLVMLQQEINHYGKGHQD